MLDNMNSRNSIQGTLYITTTHLIFVSPEVSAVMIMIAIAMNEEVVNAVIELGTDLRGSDQPIFTVKQI